ncbi:hypothetical protein RBWH47_03923 [Rhodopirellula baltica WH47]|uniref:Uncharacterized protein n=1 Tax=Rhodopirellula baltica WH47 TaxID=991778 RepID=F2ATQ0_RHOBT|nr:hypothetical protein RBWH47_03923 [Rhodopirellula baltica WH47]
METLSHQRGDMCSQLGGFSRDGVSRTASRDAALRGGNVTKQTASPSQLARLIR